MNKLQFNTMNRVNVIVIDDNNHREVKSLDQDFYKFLISRHSELCPSLPEPKIFFKSFIEQQLTNYINQ